MSTRGQNSRSAWQPKAGAMPARNWVIKGVQYSLLAYPSLTSGDHICRKAAENAFQNASGVIGNVRCGAKAGSVGEFILNCYCYGLIKICFLVRPGGLNATRVRENWFSLAPILTA